jgi:hypothetical protein
MADTLQDKLRRASGSDLLPKVMLGDLRADAACVAAANRIDDLTDKVDALQSELGIAVEAVFTLGGRGWVKSNFPAKYAELIEKENR